jgi:hypothetical protein
LISMTFLGASTGPKAYDTAVYLPQSFREEVFRSLSNLCLSYQVEACPPRRLGGPSEGE